MRKQLLSMIAAPIVGASVFAGVATQVSNVGIDVGSYWHQPLAAQGEPSRSWTKLEQSLAPADCGQCHAEQFAQCKLRVTPKPS
jgi:hypothetical protein